MTNLQRLMVSAGALGMMAGIGGFTPANAQTVVDPRPGTGNPCGTNGTVGVGGTCVVNPTTPVVVQPNPTPACGTPTRPAGSPGCGTVTPVPPVVPVNPVTPPTTGGPITVNPTVNPTINGGSTTGTVTTTVTGTNTGNFDNRDTNNVNASGGAGGQGGQGGAGGSVGNVSSTSQGGSVGNTSSTSQGGSASTGAMTQTQGSIGATGSGNVTTVQGSTTTSIYNEAKPAANSAYAPPAPTVIPGTNRCAVTNSRGGFGLTIVQGSLSAGGRGSSTLDQACVDHDRSLENRQDARSTGVEFERNGDVEYSCRMRFVAARGNPMTANNPAFTQAREDARCSPPPAPIVEVAAATPVAAARMMAAPPAPPAQDTANNPASMQALPAYENPTTCPAGSSLKDVTSRVVFNEGGVPTITMPNTQGGTTTFKISSLPVSACSPG